MADNIDPKRIEESLKNLLSAKGTTKELLAITKAYGAALGQSYSTIDKMNSAIEDQEELAKKIAKSSLDQYNSDAKKLALSKLSANIEEATYDIANKQAQVRADLVLKQTMLKHGLIEEYAEQAKNYAIALSMGELTKEEYQNKIASLKQQQESTKHIIEQIELMEEMAKLELEAREEVEKYTKGWEKTKTLLQSIVKDPQLSKTIFTGLAIKKAGEAFEGLHESMMEFRKDGESVTQAFHSLGQTLSVNSLILGQDTQGALEGLQDTMGGIEKVSRDVVLQSAGISQAFGASAQATSELIGHMAQLPGMTQESAANMTAMTGRLAVSQGVKPGKVLESMSKSTEEIAKFSAKGGESFMRAAVGAAKMGIDVTKIASAAESLLNFEDSINKQMEASVLLGREINLDKARELALNGDIAGATDEMLKQVGSETEFNKLNLLQRKALADSMGMSVADLGRMVKHQGDFTEAQKEALQDGKSLDEVLAMGVGFSEKLVGAFSRENIVFGMTALNTLTTQFGINAKQSIAWLLQKIGLSKLADSITKTGAISEAASNAEVTATIEAQTIAKQTLVGVNAELAESQQLLAVGGMEEEVGSVGLAAGIAEVAAAAVAGSEGLFILAGAVLAVGAGIGLIGVGIGLAAAGIGYMVKSFGEIPYKNLQALPLAMMGIGAGLALMAFAGIQAMPIIGMLIALGAVAPRLSGLGNFSLGGTGTTEKTNTGLEEKIQAVADNLNRLVDKLSQPGAVVMDAKRVGDALRLQGFYTTKVV